MTDGLNLIIREIKDGQQRIEDLKSFLQPKTVNETPTDTKEITVDRSTFALALQCSKTTKEAVIHEILLHFVQSLDKQPLEDVMKHLEKAIGDRMYAKNNPISNPNEEFRTHMNFKGKGGNTLLHQAVIDNNTQAIEVLFNYDINPLIKNQKDEIPLDLAQGKTRETLVKGMKKQADSKKWSAACSSSFGVIPGVFLSVGLSVGSALAGPSMAIILGAAAVFTLVAGIAVGLAIYFLSHDYKQAKSIEKAINSELSSTLTNGKEASVTAGGVGP
ncbi:ankyrin repeat domain-containing protein [Wolbachia pipientis]|uniref:ankyrin repeat domain-containing protein n=1 Tax=Wolbachia pipientis TaxID=955 RepID=UPI00202FE5D0|nr:ankyrin repeat domain-containing protein [Wolbachia pipientis]MCM1002004.1 ankyrin repeat domain-containing protein [Wolbachia pipientis]